MSKYYKAEDILAIFSEEERPLNWTDSEAEIQAVNDFDYYKRMIESLPTIEMIDNETREFCKRLHPTWDSGYAAGFNDGRKTERDRLEVSEDCIYTYCSRCGMRVVVDAPSVVPKDHSGEATEMVGEWIKEMHTNKVQIWKCDQCAEMIEQSIQYEYPRWNYCPNCGAKMKGADDE